MWLLYGWIGCTVLGYLLIRWNRYMNKYAPEWTHGDMVKNVSLGILLSPVYLIIAAMIFFVELSIHCNFRTGGIKTKFRRWWNKKSIL